MVRLLLLTSFSIANCCWRPCTEHLQCICISVYGKTQAALRPLLTSCRLQIRDRRCLTVYLSVVNTVRGHSQ
jgi:hypothetical protein